ncbi:MAG: rhomboid family intramembrane serine protease [Thermodesulfobacteriota bacterium]
MIPVYDDNPTTLKPVVTVVMIVLCALAFFWELSLPLQAKQEMIYGLGVIPAVLIGNKALPPEIQTVPPALTVLTSMFLHIGLMHLIGNMLYLWIFGNNVEDAMGHGRFTVFYLLCGIAAALTQTLLQPSSAIPMIGASGAVSGVLGAYLLLYPFARVTVIIPLGFFLQAFQLPASIVLVFWFLIQLISSGLNSSQEGGVAFFAHIGGFIAGMILIPFFKHHNISFFQSRRIKRI